MRAASIAAAVLIGLAAANSTQATRSDESESSLASPQVLLRAAIRRADKALLADDLAGASNGYRTAIDSVEFPGLPADEQHTVLVLAGGVALQQREYTAAHDWLRRATAMDMAIDADWHKHLEAAYATGDYLDSARCVTRIASRWPQTLDQIRVSAVHRILAKLDDPPDYATDRFDLLVALFEAKWTDDGMEPNSHWLDLSRQWLDRGEVSRASRVVNRIDAARTMVAVQADRRFDTVTGDGGRKIDIDAIAAAKIVRMRQRMADTPDKLAAIVALQQRLIEARQFSEALAIADATIARLEGQAGAALFSDFDDEYIWLLDLRANALRLLGRWDEAVAQRREAARRPEHGELNVSQALNLGDLLAALDRPAEALAAIAELGQLSDFGRMQLEMIQLTVAVERDDAAAVEQHLAYLRAHRKDAISTYNRALLQTERLDEAAEVLIERLRDTQWRSNALVEMQDYPDVPRTARTQTLVKRWRDVIARKPVQAELEKVGRVGKVNLAPL